jgi:predicted outer membrane protein
VEVDDHLGLCRRHIDRLATLSAAQQATGTAKSPAPEKAAAGADSAFMNSTAMAGMAEMELGKLGVQNASSSDVKQFAQRMVDVCRCTEARLAWAG